jgi:hypothetical protein
MAFDCVDVLRSRIDAAEYAKSLHKAKCREFGEEPKIDPRPSEWASGKAKGCDNDGEDSFWVLDYLVMGKIVGNRVWVRSAVNESNYEAGGDLCFIEGVYATEKEACKGCNGYEKEGPEVEDEDDNWDGSERYCEKFRLM